MIVKMPSPLRDFQRSKVYEAEKVFVSFTPDPDLIALADLQEWVDEILSTPLWQGLLQGPKRIKVKDGRGSKRAWATRKWIKMPRWTRQRGMVLHELAHSCAPKDIAESPHGPEFCSRYLALVWYHLGERQRDILQESFDKKEVLY